MTVYLVKIAGPTYDSVIGVATTVEQAQHIVHAKQAETGDERIESWEHVEVAVLETDKYIAEGA